LAVESERQAGASSIAGPPPPRDPGREVAPGSAQHHHQAARHVLAAMIDDAFSVNTDIRVLYQRQFLETYQKLHPEMLLELKAAINDTAKLATWKKDWKLTDEWCVELLLHPQRNSAFDVELVWQAGFGPGPTPQEDARLAKFFSDRRAFRRRERSAFVYEAAGPSEYTEYGHFDAATFFPIKLHLGAAEYSYDPMTERLTDFKARVLKRVNGLITELGNFGIARGRDMGAKSQQRKRGRKYYREQYEWLVRRQMGETAYAIAGGTQAYGTNDARTIQQTIQRLARQIRLTLAPIRTRHKRLPP
jgi:hypothetical protein